MATRSKANSAVSVRSKLEILEKRRLLSTTLRARSNARGQRWQCERYFAALDPRRRWDGDRNFHRDRHYVE